MAERNLKLFYFIEAFTALALGIIIPAYVVYFREFGVTLFEVAVLAAVFEGTILVFELPTGKFADRFGRKLSTTVGLFLLGASGLVFNRWLSFIGFLVAEIIFGLAETFISGALEALIVDSLDAESKEGRLSRIFANRTIFRNIGLLTGMVAGGYLAGLAIGALFLPVVLAAVIALIGSLFLREPQTREYKAAATESYSIGKLFEIVKSNRLILGLFAVGLMANFAFEPADQYWQVLMDEIKGIDVRLFGFLTGAGLVLTAILARITERYFRRPTLFFAWVFIIVAGGFVMASEMSIYPAIAGLIAFFSLKSLIQPVFSTNLNIEYSTINRATFLSSFNLTCSIGEVAAALAAGLAVTFLGVPYLFLAAAVVAPIIIVVFRLILLKSR